MTGAEVLDLGRDALWTTVLMAGPAMLIGLAVGVAIALIQALTQVQEITLTFVPKIIAILLTVSVSAPFIGSQIGRLNDVVFSRIATGF